MSLSIAKCLFLILVSFSIQAQDMSISGKVIDRSTHEVIIGAHVFLLSDWRKGTATDINGAFMLGLQGSSGDGSLIVSALGYEERLIPLRELDAQAVIELKPMVREMEAVTISAERLIAEEFRIQEIERMEIYSNPSAKADPLLAVNALPSSTTTDESANVSFRGSPATETGIFFNNVPIYDPVRFSQLNGIGTFSIFNTQLLENVLVFPGNPPLEFGNTTSGLIALQTDESVPQRSSKSISATVASLGLSIRQPIRKKTAITAYANYQPSLLISGINGDALADIPFFQTLDLGIQAVHLFSDKTLFKVFNYSLIEGYDFVYRHPTFNGILSQNRRKNFTIANFRHRLKSGTISINQGASFSRQSFVFSSTDIQTSVTDLYFSGNYSLERSKWGMKTGISYDQRQLHLEGTLAEFSYAIAEEHPTLEVEASSRVSLPEGFAYLKYYWNERLTLGFGIRKNIPVDMVNDFVSAQGNINYEIKELHTLKLGGGRFNAARLPLGETSPVNIQTDQLNLDYLFVGENLKFTMSAYYKLSRSGPIGTRTMGLETQANWKFRSKLNLDLSYALIDAQASNGVPSGFDMNYFVRAGIKYEPGANWILNARLIWRQGIFFRRLASVEFDSQLGAYEPILESWESSVRLPDYKIIDLSISKLFPVNESLTIIGFASMSNVLNSRNVRSYSYDFDYGKREEEVFGLRILFFGVMINFF